MPELPDLEIIREFLAPRLAAVRIESAQVLRPLVVRNLFGDDVSARLAGKRISRVEKLFGFDSIAVREGRGEEDTKQWLSLGRNSSRQRRLVIWQGCGLCS